MSQENLELIRRLYRAMDAQDLKGIEQLAHPDVEWIPDVRVGEGPIRGRVNVIKFFLDRREMFGELRTEVERSWGTDDKVLTFIRLTGHGAASGARFDIRIGHLWTVQDGVAVRGEAYGNRDEALKAAGLSE